LLEWVLFPVLISNGCGQRFLCLALEL
jgi:hypothetical protein